MKKIIPFIFIAFLFLSCDKKIDGTTKTGDIRVTVKFESPSGAASLWSWEQVEVRLYKDDKVIATMYANYNQPNVDFGEYDYGDNYAIITKSRVHRMNASGSLNYTNDAWSDATFFKVDKKTVSVTSYLKVH